MPSTAEPGERFKGRDLAGWVRKGPHATFCAVKGELCSSGAKHPNFRMEFEYKLSQWTEAAVYPRAPRMGRPARQPLRKS